MRTNMGYGHLINDKDELGDPGRGPISIMTLPKHGPPVGGTARASYSLPFCDLDVAIIGAKLKESRISFAPVGTRINAKIK